MIRMWALRRRIIYLVGVVVFLALVSGALYFLNWYEKPTCFDALMNGDERGTDCGGSCVRICVADILPPSVTWAKVFEIVPGQYNAVAYVENQNRDSGSSEIPYTFRLKDKDGIIVERTGKTVLPPDSTYPVFEGRIMTGTRIPTDIDFILDLGGETVWQPATMGREQFNVVERFLRNADVLPKLDARITNTALTPARDVEVIATIFDAYKNPVTASRTVVPYFAPRTTEDVVFTWQAPIAKTVRSCEVPTDVVLAIDLSGSMNDDGGSPPEPVTSVLKAASAFISRLGANDQVGVVTYATTASVREVLTNNRTKVESAVSGFTIGKADETGRTNTGDAILKAKDELSSSRHNQNARKVLVFLTDGLANAPEPNAEQFALDAAQKLKDTGTEIYTIGLGAKSNETFLKNIASKESYYYKAATAGVVDTIYRTVTSALCEEGPAIIEIIPKTEAIFTPLQ